MNHQWSYQESNFLTHQNQQSFHLPYQERFDPRKFNARAYVNPHVVSYEHIKRSLAKPPLGNNKILVNPNFKRSQKEYYLNFNNLIFSNHSYSRLNDLSQPETSNTSSTNNKEVNSKNMDLEMSLSKSRFRKINKLSLSKPKYSWYKNENASDLSKSSSILFSKSTKNCKKAVPVLSQDMYKFIAPKKTKIQTPEKSISRLYLSKTKIINKSKTKLVNNNMIVNRKITKVYSPIKIPFCKFEGRIKKSVTLKVAKAVTNMYKYYNSAKQSKNLRYKIDKRNKTETLKKGNLNGISDISKLFPDNFHTRLKFSQKAYGSTHKNFNLQRENQLPQKVNPVISKKFPNIRVVKIGGILYKTTTNKLTLAKNKEQKKQMEKNHVVYVRGEKFLLENNGKTLRRQPESMSKEKNQLQTLKRIDIGGVTYIQKSKNVLVRTNIHQTQYLVRKAKNKSIAILMNLRKKSTLPCMIYHRFGKCNRHNKGLCMYKHDPKNIAICKMFLKGDCTNNNCLLFHQAIPEKMATCHFFLNGFCDRDNCPFPHVKLNKNVAICEKFLQGFCKLGKECSRRHLYQCPNFDKFGTCSLGSKCHYPHKVSKKNKSIGENTNKTDENNEKGQYLIDPGIHKSKRKLKKCLLKKENKAEKRLKLENLSWDSSDQTNDIIKCVPKRIKLDKLPCYIPLKNDDA